MDLIKNALEKIKPGQVTVLYGMIVCHVGRKFIVGETIKMSGERLTIDEAIEFIYAEGKQRYQ